MLINLKGKYNMEANKLKRGVDKYEVGQFLECWN